MEEQIRLFEANNTGFSDWQGIDLFNVKFRLEDVTFEEYIELPATHPVHLFSRYSFGRYQEGFAIYSPAATSGFQFTPSASTVQQPVTPLQTYTLQRQPKAIEITNLHRNISDNLVVHLRELYGNSNVTPEHPTGYGGKRIDIVVNNNGALIFYEIKTYASLQTSIREALGQIFEYAFWPAANNARELIVVTQQHDDYIQAEQYMSHLRKLLGIKIYYQPFDVNANRLLTKY